MENVLFLQSEVKDPFAFYERMRKNHPVYFDTSNNVWAVYCLKGCMEVLQNSIAHVPGLQISPAANEEVRTVLQNLPRLANPPRHSALRKVSLELMQQLKTTDVPFLVHYLIGEPRKPASIDWINDVAKKLTALAILKGYSFSDVDMDSILPVLNDLTKIMQPVTSGEEMKTVNDAVKNIFTICRSHFYKKYNGSTDHENNIYTSNLIGLLIQSYDAGRGLLSNALLQACREESSYGRDYNYFNRIVKESLLVDPPVHNTRRVMTKEIVLNNKIVEPGDTVLVVLASANHDAHSTMNQSGISYGAGAHQCVAEDFTIYLAASTLHYLYSKYNSIELIEKEILYEPRINVRLPRSIHLTIS
jgi:cytochrome P450